MKSIRCRPHGGNKMWHNVHPDVTLAESGVPTPFLSLKRGRTTEQENASFTERESYDKTADARHPVSVKICRKTC